MQLVVTLYPILNVVLENIRRHVEQVVGAAQGFKKTWGNDIYDVNDGGDINTMVMLLLYCLYYVLHSVMRNIL